MAHVTVPDEPTRVSYTVTTSDDGPFSFAFSYFSADDIEVYNGTSLIDPNDYTLTPVTTADGGYEGGSITLDTPVSNTTISIIRNVPIERTTDFPVSGPFAVNTLNSWLDKTYAILQQIATKLTRSIRLTDTDASATLTLPVAASRALKILSFDASGNVTVTDVANIGDLQLPVSVANGGTGQITASAAFDALKQAATETASGVLEIATAAETTTGTDDTRAITPLKLTTFAPATATPDTGADSVIFLDATDSLLKKGTFPSTGLAAASQAEMETATSNAVASTPGRQHHHPGHPKAWVNFNGTGTIAIRADYGVASLTDHGGSGEYSITFDTAFSSANYCAIGICDRTINTTHGTEGIQTVTFGTGAFRFICASSVPTATDQEYVAIAFWGDQ
jgi:hypothetical protein